MRSHINLPLLRAHVIRRMVTIGVRFFLRLVLRRVRTKGLQLRSDGIVCVGRGTNRLTGSPH